MIKKGVRTDLEWKYNKRLQQNNAMEKYKNFVIENRVILAEKPELLQSLKVNILRRDSGNFLIR